MVKNHLKRINAPKSWPVKRKSDVFITRPNTGAHGFNYGMAISTLFKEVMGVCKTTKEVANVINHKNILVDGKKIKDTSYNVGLYDAITVEGSKENFRVLFNEYGKLAVVSVDEKDVKLKPCKIISKSVIKGGKVQLNLYDGKNVIVDKDVYAVGDTVVLELSSMKIKEHVKFDKDAFVQITDGKNAGKYGQIVEVNHFDTNQRDLVVFKTSEGEEISTVKSYAFVLGAKKSVISLGE